MSNITQPTSLYKSETSKHREIVAPYCTGVGMDIGFGGDPVSLTALRMDLPQPYAFTGEFPVQLPGDCRDLRWLRDDVLDYVYSSHVLEDFDENETEPVMREWSRVLRVGGRLILLLPDQQRYLAYCQSVGIKGNPHHSIAHFSINYVLDIASRLGNLESEAQHLDLGDYSFALVLKKIKSVSAINETEDLRTKVHAAWRERDELKLAVRDRENKLQQMRIGNLAHKPARVLRRIISGGEKK